jgi:large subunit ribosomal protein L16
MKQLIPRRTKFKKYHKGVIYNKTFKRINLNVNSCTYLSLKLLNGGRITSKQIESVRSTISKIIKKIGCLQIYAFALLPISKKPVETRMGKGKGSVDHWVFCAKPGFIFCRIYTKNFQIAINALKIAKGKLPLLTKITINK